MEQELEFILRDIVDDLKKLRADNITQQNDSGIIIQQLNTFEKLLREQRQPPSTPINIKPVEELIEKELWQVKNLITTNALNKRIEHKHYLHKGLLVSLILTLLCLLLTIGWYKSYDSSKQLRANDIKYRALKVVGDKSLLKLLHHTDSLYLLNRDSFEMNLDAAENLKAQP